jgi:hypothetical protein
LPAKSVRGEGSLKLTTPWRPSARSSSKVLARNQVSPLPGTSSRRTKRPNSMLSSGEQVAGQDRGVAGIAVYGDADEGSPQPLAEVCSFAAGVLETSPGGTGSSLSKGVRSRLLVQL